MASARKDNDLLQKLSLGQKCEQFMMPPFLHKHVTTIRTVSSTDNPYSPKLTKNGHQHNRQNMPTLLCHEDLVRFPFNRYYNHSRVNKKFAQFCVTEKKRTEVVSPPPSHPPNRHHDDMIASWEEKRERGRNVTCVISVKIVKLTKWRNLCKSWMIAHIRLVNLPTFLLGVLSPQTREHLSTVV
ncbi:hypothetical protein TNCV_4462111 [Trichonephila clavipes]|nr:hypothetical protein TNCV_4462111 [Trichonephila clavipes]